MRGPASFPTFRTAVLALTALLAWAPLARAGTSPQYVSPRPGATRVSTANNIVVRWGPALDVTAARRAEVLVTGSVSGPHAGTVRLSDDGRTLVFLPARHFAPSERVAVTVGGVRTAAGETLPPVECGFTTAAVAADRAIRRDPLQSLRSELPARTAAPAAQRAARSPSTNALPAGYPALRVLASNDPPPGCLFLSPIRTFGLYMPGHLVIADNFGQPLFYRETPTTAWDFKRQPNGLMTYFTAPAVFIALDSTGAVVDSFKTGNGYETDAHDLQVLPNGHALIAAYDWQPVDMSQVVPGGDPDAIVGGYIVQELDTQKNVVFQWSSWDHIPITDMVECIGSFLDPVIDYVHGNSMELDHDGNLILSSRHLNEITKIDRQTGDVMWRFGRLAKQNQFAIYNDSRGFSHQHDARRLPNGRLLVYDNANCLDPRYARVLEYTLDEENLAATLVWQYWHWPLVDAPSMGNSQRLASGGTVIGWGGSFSDVQVTEIHANGSIALDLGFEDPPWYSYRAFRFPWGGAPVAANPDSLDFGLVRTAAQAYLPFTVRNTSAAPVTITEFASTDTQLTVTTPVPFTLQPGDSVQAVARFAPVAPGALAGRIYARSVNGTEVVAAAVDVSGESAIGVPAGGPWAAWLLALGLAAAAAVRLRRPRPEAPG